MISHSLHVNLLHT